MSRDERLRTETLDDVESRINAMQEMYWDAVAKMSIEKRFRRLQEFVNVTREFHAREIRAMEPGLSDEELKWRVAARMYRHDPNAIALLKAAKPYVSS